MSYDLSGSKIRSCETNPVVRTELLMINEAFARIRQGIYPTSLLRDISHGPFAFVELDHLTFDAGREFEAVAGERCAREMAELPMNFDMYVAHCGAVAVAHRRIDAIDQPCAFRALRGRQPFRAREHVAMERAPIRFEQHQRNERRLDQQDFAEQK